MSIATNIGPGMLVEPYRFTFSDGGSFEHVGEAVYASPLAAEAHAIQIAMELSEDHGTAVGFRCTIRAAVNSRGGRSASKERSRGRKPLGETRSQPSAKTTR